VSGNDVAPPTQVSVNPSRIHVEGQKPHSTAMERDPLPGNSEHAACAGDLVAATETKGADEEARHAARKDTTRQKAWRERL